MAQVTSRLEIIHLATYRPKSSPVGTPFSQPLASERVAIAPELKETAERLSRSEVIKVDDVGSGTVVVRWHYLSPHGMASDGCVLAEEATRVELALKYDKANAPELDELRSTHDVHGESTVALAPCCTDLHPRTAKDFFEASGFLGGRALRLGKDDEPTIWKQRAANYYLVLADPDTPAPLQQLSSFVMAGELDRVEAWWHNIDRCDDDYLSIRGTTGNVPAERAGLLGLRDDLGDHMRAMLGERQDPEKKKGILAIIKDELKRALRGTRPERTRQEIMVRHYHEIGVAATRAASIRAELQRCRINLKEEVRQLRGLASAIGDNHIREARFPLERIRLDLETVQPHLDTAEACLQKDTDERVGVLTLWVVPLTMMQVVLTILQTGWTSATTWPLRALGILLSGLILVAFLPGIRYSLNYARENRGIRSLTALVVLVAVVCYLMLPLLLFVLFR